MYISIFIKRINFDCTFVDYKKYVIINNEIVIFFIPHAVLNEYFIVC